MQDSADDNLHIDMEVCIWNKVLHVLIILMGGTGRQILGFIFILENFIFIDIIPS